ncbi:MAG: hypothetical protein RR250_07605, partial [Akkermansia sp.]
GAKPHDLVMTPGVIDKVIGGKHTVPREALEQLPAAIADPVCVAVSDTNGSVEVITSLMENGNNVLVAVELNAGSRESRQLKVNRITSLYGKESIGKFITHPMLYWSKAKAREWLANYGLQLPTTGLPKANSKGKLLKPDDLVKWKEKNGINFSTQGDEIKSQAQRFIASGQAAQARFWEATSKRIGKEIVSEANESVNFSIFSPSEAEGIHALQSITKGAKEARFRSDTLNQDVILELGRAGKEKANGKVTGYYGLNHLIAQRLVEGDSMEEACYTAVKSVLAAVDGEIAKKNIAEDRRILTLDRYHAAISLSWNGEKGAWMISGFKENSKNTSADDRKKAAYLASNYAVDQFGCFEGLGAALDYAIARVAREYKENLGKNAVSNSVNFSLGSGGITLESETTAWGKQLSEYLDGENPLKNRDMRVCTTPAVLRMLGAKPHDLAITPGVIDKVMKGKHSVSLEAMEQLPKAISEPIAVFDSTTSSNSLVILTELKEGDDNIVVAVHLDSKSSEEAHTVTVNRIMSLYGKDNARALLNQPMRYLDIKKARPWLVSYGLQLPEQVAKTGSKRKLLKPDDLVKWKEKNGINFSTQGDEIKSQAQRFIASGQAAQARFWEATSKRIGKEIDRVDKLLSGEITSREEYLLAVNRAIGVVQTAAAMLPPGYRFSVDPYVTWLTKYAELASTGSMKLDDIPQFIEAPLRKKLEALEAEQGSTDWAKMRGEGLMGRFLERVNSKVDEFTKDSYKKAMSKIIASVMPKKTKTGAPQRSRALDADATRTVLSIAESMGLEADALDGRLAAIEQETVSELKYILKRRDVAQRIIASIGKDRYDTLLKWIDRHELGGVEQGRCEPDVSPLANATRSPLDSYLIFGDDFWRNLTQGRAVSSLLFFIANKRRCSHFLNVLEAFETRN